MNAYWKPAADIYLWHLNAGLDFWTRRQTAYVFTAAHTATPHLVAPFVLARRSLLTRNRSLWSAQVRCTAVTGSNDGVVADASLSYEMPLRGTKLRPSLALNYCFSRVSSATRNSVGITASATF